MTGISRHAVFLLPWVSLVLSAGSARAQASMGEFASFQQVSSHRVSRFVTEFEYRAILRNDGPALENVTATITSTSPETTVMDLDLAFGDVAEGVSVASLDTFSFQQDRRFPFDPTVLHYAIHFDAVPVNNPPVADAGPDQTVLVAKRVTLDGSASSDVDGDPLTFLWRISSLPPGSTAALSTQTAVTPSFVADVKGTYVVELVVNDGSEDSAPDNVVIDTENSPPVADAGPDQTARVTDVVILDGSGSHDVDGDPLTFSWSLTVQPAGSVARIADPAAVAPSLDLDLPGTYVVALVVNDGALDSAPDTVSIDTENSPPVAHAGPDQTVFVAETVALDGSGSTDVDGDSLAYLWSFTSRPPGSHAVLSDAGAVMPHFVADVSGRYVVQLIVNDGIVDSAPDTVGIDTENSPPVADAGPDRTAFVADTVSLDGSGSSDVDGDVLSFAWSLTSLPAGSAAMLSDPTAVMPRFEVDLPGRYVAQLIVNDGTVDSAPDTVRVDTENSAPVANAGADQTVRVGDRVGLDGSNSTDVDGDSLTFAWSLATTPVGSAASLSDASAVMPSFDVDLPGTYVVQLIVDDGLVASAPDTVTVDTENSPPVADAGSDQTAFVGDTVALDGTGSSDVDHDLLTMRWSVIARPPGSGAALSNPAATRPTFEVDAAGTYVLQLIVNDGALDSAPDSVMVTTSNSAPVADAGPDQVVHVTDAVRLDGSGSSDVDGDALTFFWTLPSVPAGSGATLDDPVSPAPGFVADLPGTYVASLVVNDGTADSAPNNVVIVTENSRPVAYAGGDRTVALGGTVVLDGSLSHDDDSDPLTYRWTLVTLPTGSAARLSDATSVAPSFVADVVGDYVVELVVNDGALDSDPDAATVTVDPNPAIVAFSRTIGAGLQYVDGATLEVANHGGVTVRIESGNPAIVLVAPDGLTPGAGFVDVFVPDGSNFAPYAVQGVAGAAGTVSVTASAMGFSSGTGTIAVTQPAVTFLGLSTTPKVGVNDSFAVLIGVPNGAGTGLAAFQGVSASNQPALELTVVSSDGNVGRLMSGATTADSLTLPTASGEFEWFFMFVPLAAGPTTVTGSIPGFLTLAGGALPLTVAPPSVTPFSRTVGAGLEYESLASLSTASHGGVTVHIESSNPAVALVAPDGLTPGSPFIDVFVPDGRSTASYAVQGVSGTMGTVIITASAPGFTSGQGTITVVQPAIAFVGLSPTASVGVNDAFTVLTGIPNGSGTALDGIQGLSAANVPALQLTLTSSDGGLGQLSFAGTTATTVLVPTLPRQFQFLPSFVPLSPGAVTVTGSIPGFLTTTSGSQTVTVNP
jgi:K319L-like, PKD domain/PKD domain